MQHVFIIGSRGLPANYGGFETFVERLVTHKQSADIQYHVANITDKKGQSDFVYQGARVYNVYVPPIGAARVIAYDMLAINRALKTVRQEQIDSPIFLILGNTIGALIAPYIKKIHRYKGRVFVNPDGLEWRRSKWPRLVRCYLKYAEKQMVRHADMIVSDNPGIDSYLRETYGQVTSQVIAYGTEIGPISVTEAYQTWAARHQVSTGEYYLIVGRFVPENNYQLLLEAFMRSTTAKQLVIVTNHEDNPYYKSLEAQTGFASDARIKFVGTVYDPALLRAIRQEAYAYLHGHEVGGTNPGLLEAMWASPLNLVLGVNFNREVTQDSALYFDKTTIDQVLAQAEILDEEERRKYHQRAQELILSHYTWAHIVGQYEALFLGEQDD